MTILPVGTDFSAGFSEETEIKFSRDDSTIKVLDNSMKPLDFSEEASQKSGMQLVLVPQDVGNPDLWNQSNIETFSNFLGFPTMGMEKKILKFFKKLRSKREKILTKE